MKRIVGVSFLVAMLLSGCGKSTLDIAGDSQSVGAEIFIDGQKVGVMEKLVVVGLKSKNPDEDKKLNQRFGIKPGEVRAHAFVEVPSGEYEIAFVSVEGKQLKKRFKIRGENYLNVSFEKMTIEGE